MSRHFIHKPFYRSNEMKSTATFNDDIDSVNKNIERIVGQSIDSVDMIEDLQDELDDLQESQEWLGNMLARSR